MMVSIYVLWKPIQMLEKGNESEFKRRNKKIAINRILLCVCVMPIRHIYMHTEKNSNEFFLFVANVDKIIVYRY